MTNGIPHPFEIFWDVDSASYYIFVPDGCVLVNGVAAENDEVENGNLALDFGETPPKKVYCHVWSEKDEESDEEKWLFSIDGEAEKKNAKYNVLVATFGREENDGQSYDVVCSAISLGGESEADEISIESSREVPGEVEGEESTVVEELAIEGWHDKDNSTSKLGDLLTGDTEDESRQILVRNGKGGATEYLPLGKVAIPDQEEVVGSDYIAAETKQVQGVPKREISAKITTPDPDDRTVENPVHALLTHDTDQFVRSKKTFKNADGTKTIELDAATGVETISHGTSSQQKKIVLNPSQIPDDCQQKTIQVKTLTVNHPRAKTAGGPTSETFHILSCDDATINEGDAIEKIESGTSTQDNGYTITPVIITLKDGTKLTGLSVKAKNGADGDPGADGDDAGLKVSAVTHTPTQADPRTGIDVTLTPTVNGVDQTPTTFTIYDGKQGVGIGSVEEDPSQASGRTRKYKVMSDEAVPKLLGTLTVTDGRSIGTIALKSTSGKTKTYSVMSDETPAQEIGTFVVTDGDDGTPAGFGTPTATATELEPGVTPTASVSASGPDTAKVFAFEFGIPKGRNIKSNWDAPTGSDAEIENKPELQDFNLVDGDSEQLLGKFYGDSGIDLGQRNIVGRNHISVEIDGNNILIGDSIPDNEVTAGKGITVVANNVRANTDDKSVECIDAQNVDQKKIQIAGFNDIANHLSQHTLGQALIEQIESGEYAIVATYINGTYAIRYKRIDTFPIEADSGVGITLTQIGNAGNKTLKLDLLNRGTYQFGVNDFKVNGTLIGKVFSSSPINVNVIVPDLSAGRGISISTAGNVSTINADIAGVVSDSSDISVTIDQNGIAHISLTGGSSQNIGYTGSIKEVVDAEYDTNTHKLTKVFRTKTYNNGILTAVSNEEEELIEQAVPETVSQ